jgi:hypothetical protein
METRSIIWSGHLNFLTPKELGFNNKKPIENNKLQINEKT